MISVIKRAKTDQDCKMTVEATLFIANATKPPKNSITVAMANK